MFRYWQTCGIVKRAGSIFSSSICLVFAIVNFFCSYLVKCRLYRLWIKTKSAIHVQAWDSSLPRQFFKILLRQFCLCRQDFKRYVLFCFHCPENIRAEKGNQNNGRFESIMSRFATILFWYIHTVSFFFTYPMLTILDFTVVCDFTIANIPLDLSTWTMV